MTAKTRTATLSRKGNSMRFYILSPYKLDALEHHLEDFISEDLMYILQSANTKIAVDESHLKAMERAYPKYYKYEVIVGRK